jgi:hypothetical protein
LRAPERRGLLVGDQPKPKPARPVVMGVEDRMAVIAELHAEGFSSGAIAKRLGVHVTVGRRDLARFRQGGEGELNLTSAPWMMSTCWLSAAASTRSSNLSG